MSHEQPTTAPPSLTNTMSTAVSRPALRRSSKRASIRRASVSSSTSSSSRGKSKVRRGKDNDDALAMLRSVWRNHLSPALTTMWTYSAMFWTFIITFAAQTVIKKVDERKDEKERMSLAESAVTHGSVFHGLVSMFVVETNPFWSRSVIWDVPKEDLPKRCIFMINHISFADAFVVCGVLPESKAVGQAKLWDIPLVGDVFRNNGDMAVFFERKPDGKWGTKPGAKEALMKQATDYLANDVPVAVFPEGTITRTGHLLPFKPGFFKLAVETGVPVVPVGMWGNQTAWPMDLSNLDVSTPKPLMGPADIYVRVGAPIESTGRSVDELMDAVFDNMDGLVKSLPNYSLEMYEHTS